MAEGASARREARKKRILENSQNRLQFISGKKSAEDCARDSPSKFSYSEQSYEDPIVSCSSSSTVYLPSVNNGMVVSEPESRAFLSDPHDAVAAGDNGIANDLTAFVSSSTEAVKVVSPLEKIVTYKYDVALLALIVQLWYNLFMFETAYFFLPLVIYTVTKLIWFPMESKSNQFANAFLLLNGFSADKVDKLMNVTKWIGVISQDICVYLFVTICIQSLIITIRSNVLA